VSSTTFSDSACYSCLAPPTLRFFRDSASFPRAPCAPGSEHHQRAASAVKTRAKTSELCDKTALLAGGAKSSVFRRLSGGTRVRCAQRGKHHQRAASAVGTNAEARELRVETALLAADAKSLFLEGFLTRSGLILCLRRSKKAEACSGRYQGRGRAGPPGPRVV